MSEREQKYAEAIFGRKEPGVMVSMLPRHNYRESRMVADVMAVADAELAEAHAEIERLTEELAAANHARRNAEARWNRGRTERDALRAQVEAVRALSDSPSQPGRWVLPEDENEPAVWVTDLAAALSSSEPVTAGDEDGMGSWFRRTPESLAMLAEETEALAKLEAEPAGEVTPPAEQRPIIRPNEEPRYIGGCAGFECHDRCPGGGVCCCREEDR